MNATGFEFNRSPAPAEPQGDRQREAEPRVMRAAPEEKKDDKSGDEPPDEPGYGHGV